MTLGWKNLSLQARFMVLASSGVLMLAAATFALIIWFEFTSLEDKLRAFSKNEIKSLNALVDSAMARRLCVHDKLRSVVQVSHGCGCGSGRAITA